MRFFLLTVFLLPGTAIPAFSAPAEDRLELQGSTMGTYYSVVIDTPTESLGDGSSLKAKIEARLKEINRQMSTWDETSEISAFNQSQSTDWFAVSPEFAAVVAEARRIYELSDGVFDPTVAPLIDLWGFGDRRPKEMPDDASIAAAMTSVGMQHVKVRREPAALQKAIPDLQLNLSAIAKGYGVDSIAELLIAAGQPRFVVDIGGENRTGGPKASGDPWKLGIESPLGGMSRILPLTQMSIATSGDYRNFFQKDGVTYSHAIDPTTGRPVRNPPASVSVVHPSCMTADAWATTLMLLGSERGRVLAEQQNLSVMFQDVVEGAVKEVALGVFADAEQVAETVSTPSVAESPGDASGDESATSLPWFPFAAAAVVFLIAIAGMAIGTILQNKSIKGSCGGLAAMPGSEGKSICELCTIPKEQCTNTELREQMQAAAAGEAQEPSAEHEASAP